MESKRKIYKRHNTEYPGVYYIIGNQIKTGKRGKVKSQPERIYLLSYYRGGRRILEKAGRQFRDDMTPARASQMRARRITGVEASNSERRLALRATKESKSAQWTFEKIWVEYKKLRPEAKRSATDETNFTLHLSPTFGNKEPASVVPLDVDRFRRSLSKKKAAGTVKNILELLRRLSNFAKKKHLCAPLPFKISIPRVNNIRTEDLTPEQMTRLLEVLRVGVIKGENGGKDTVLDRDARDMMLLALFTGMRRGEILRLRWDDVDFQRAFIKLRETKGGTDQTIPLSKDTRKLLDSRLGQTRSDYVFPGRKKDDHRKDASKSFRAIRAAAGLPDDFRPMHGLRHTFASSLASSGKVDLYTLQRLLTHKSPQMTMRYAHLRNETLMRATNIVGQIYSSLSPIDTEKQIGPQGSRE